VGVQGWWQWIKETLGLQAEPEAAPTWTEKLEAMLPKTVRSLAEKLPLVLSQSPSGGRAAAQ